MDNQNSPHARFQAALDEIGRDPEALAASLSAQGMTLQDFLAPYADHLPPQWLIELVLKLHHREAAEVLERLQAPIDKDLLNVLRWWVCERAPQVSLLTSRETIQAFLKRCVRLRGWEIAHLRQPDDHKIEHLYVVVKKDARRYMKSYLQETYDDGTIPQAGDLVVWDPSEAWAEQRGDWYARTLYLIQRAQ